MPSVGHEFWTNLAQAYILLGQKEEALKVMQIASEIDKDLWEVWRDLMLVSAACRNYDIVLTAYDKIVDLGINYKNEEILESLVDNSLKINDPKCTEDITTLFDRIAKMQNDPIIWIIYAKLAASVENAFQLMVNRLGKAKGLITSKDDWLRKPASVIRVLLDSQKLAYVYLECYSLLKSSQEKQTLLLYGISSITDILEKIKENHTDVILSRIKPAFEVYVFKLQETLENMVVKL